MVPWHGVFRRASLPLLLSCAVLQWLASQNHAQGHFREILRVGFLCALPRWNLFVRSIAGSFSMHSFGGSFSVWFFPGYFFHSLFWFCVFSTLLCNDVFGAWSNGFFSERCALFPKGFFRQSSAAHFPSRPLAGAFSVSSLTGFFSVYSITVVSSMGSLARGFSPKFIYRRFYPALLRNFFVQVCGGGVQFPWALPRGSFREICRGCNFSALLAVNFKECFFHGSVTVSSFAGPFAVRFSSGAFLALFWQVFIRAVFPGIFSA